MVSVEELNKQIMQRVQKAYLKYTSKGLTIPADMQAEITNLSKKRDRQLNPTTKRSPPLNPTTVDTSHDNETVPSDANTYGPGKGSNPDPIDAESIEDSNYQGQQASSNLTQGGPQNPVPGFQFDNIHAAVILLGVGIWIYCRYNK